MTHSVVTTEPALPLSAAGRLMRAGRFRHLPVVHDERLVGIISDRDLDTNECRQVDDVMHTNVIVVTPDTPIEVAAKLMLDNKIGALPVVVPGTDTLVGIVSQTDLFGILARLLGGDGPSTRLELVVDDLPRQLATIANIAQQRGVAIGSLVTLPAEPTATQRQLVLRIVTMQAKPFVAELRHAGIQVDEPADVVG